MLRGCARCTSDKPVTFRRTIEATYLERYSGTMDGVGTLFYADRPKAFEGRRNQRRPIMDLTTLLIVVLLLGGGGWYGRGRWN